MYFTGIHRKPKRIAAKVLTELYNRKFYDAALIMSTNTYEEFNIYGLNIYTHSNVCYENPTVVHRDTCKTHGMSKNARLFQRRAPKDFDGCTINVVAMRYQPFVINSTSGFEVSLLEEVGKILNVSFNMMVTEKAVDWGTRHGKNNWSGPLGEVLEISGLGIGKCMAGGQDKCFLK